MRLSELSEHTGVPTATIKYYLREGLLRPGRTISATKAEYGDEHVRRLRLIRALVQVGRMPLATAREVLAAVDDDTLDQHARLGAATWALPNGTEPGDDAATATAHRIVDDLLRELGWDLGEKAAGRSPAHRTLVASVAALGRLGYPCDVTTLLPYARAAAGIAAHDLDLIEPYERPADQVEAAVAMTVLYEPVLLSLRRMAHAEESLHRHAR